jgi:hypothetical protein
MVQEDVKQGEISSGQSQGTLGCDPEHNYYSKSLCPTVDVTC